MLQALHISKKYGELQVLKDVSLSIEKGEIVSLVGSSGAGKSTLLHIVGSLDAADSGQVTINNQDLSRLSSKQLAAFRNKNIGFVFQFHHLLPEFSAFENVCIPAYIANTNKKVAEERAHYLLNLLGLSQRLQNKPSELSGGEQQRVAVARALVNNPAIVLADEPSGNLDSANAQELHQLFFDLREKMGQTFLIVTHNESLAGMSDRTLQMKDGKML